MAKKYVTWRGEDIETDDGSQTAGPSFLMWGPFKFDKGKPVLVDDEEVGKAEMAAHILAMAPTNQFFHVSDSGEEPEEEYEYDDSEEDDDEPQNYADPRHAHHARTTHKPAKRKKR